MRKGYPIALKNGISGSIFRYRCNFQYVKNKKRNRILRHKNQIENQKENQIEKQKEKQKEKHIKSI